MRLALIVLIPITGALVGCQPKQVWLSPPKQKDALCRSLASNLARNNEILQTFYEGDQKLPPFEELQDEAVLPGGRIYVSMVTNLSDRELLRAINNREITPSYVYEYAERLYRRGHPDKALPLAWAGTISPSPQKYRFSKKYGIQYSENVVKQIGGDMPSECLATEICKELITERPLYWSHCQAMRYRNRTR
jgi:hypothetical protein